MKTFVCIAALAASASAGSLSVDMAKNAPSPFEGATTRAHARDLQSRGKTGSIHIGPIGPRYVIKMTIGQPPQEVGLTVDTGSTDMFVLADSAPLCSGDTIGCVTPYSFNASTTAEAVDDNDIHGIFGFKAAFADESGASGFFIKDDITIEGIHVKKQIMGLATETTNSIGLIGLGLDPAESTNSLSNVRYTSFLDNLVKQDIIDTRLFSMFMNNTGAETGTILFGGVDTERYYDNLAKLPLVLLQGDLPNEPSLWAVNLTSVTARGIDGFPPIQNTIGILDSGTTTMELPEPNFKAIAKFLGGIQVPNSTVDNLWVDCARNDTNASLTVQFGAKTIYMPIANGIRPSDMSDEDNKAFRKTLGPKADSWKRACPMDYSLPATPGNLLLGDTFLRSAYVVHDVENRVVGIAQANLKSTKSNVIEIGKGGSIPNNKGSPVPTQVVQTGSDGSSSTKGNDKKDNAGAAFSASSAISMVVAMAAAVMIM